MAQTGSQIIAATFSMDVESMRSKRVHAPKTAGYKVFVIEGRAYCCSPHKPNLTQFGAWALWDKQTYAERSKTRLWVSKGCEV